MRILYATGFISLTLASTALGQIVVPGADGSDGAFNPTSNTVINLALAPTGTWNGANTSPGNGVYDIAKWAIVFRYSSVNIPSGVTVTFLNHPSNPPVVWLVSGPVTIGGFVNLNYKGVTTASVGFSLPGPGGFRGAGSNGNTAGLGPGATGVNQHANYGYGVNAYGNARCMPLIGGSGGTDGHGAGGAILIACSGTITLNGAISANANGGGTGGAIRLLCNRLDGTGTVQAASYYGGTQGRIRFESNQLGFGSQGDPIASFGLPGATAQIWPDDATDPSVRVVSLTGIPIPADPTARFDFPAADLNITNGTGQQLLIEAKNVPTGSDPPDVQAWNVVARVVPRGSAPFTVNATLAGGNFATSTWTATLNMPTGFSAVQVRASMPPQ